jgi:L-serine---[L-seryl-carrier protein] ligase
MGNDDIHRRSPMVEDAGSSSQEKIAGAIAPSETLAKNPTFARVRKKSRRRNARPPNSPSAPGASEGNTDDKIENLPLSIAQRGIWIGHKISRVGTVFNIAEAVEIHGPVDPAVFIAALWRITEEVEATRTNIYEDAQGPRQIIHSKYQGDIPFIDCTGEEDPENYANQWMMNDVTAPLDMEREPLWFCALLKLAPDHYYWHHRAHHIIYDGYSGGLIARRLSEIYNAEIAGETPPPSTFTSLRTMVEIEETYRTSKSFIRDRQYWLDRLADLPEAISFAQGRWPTANGLARETAYLSPERTKQLSILAKQLSCTMPQLLISLAAAFIYRTTGASDLVFGMPVSARSKAIRNTPGLAANAILLRLAMTPDLCLTSLAAETAREVLHALRRQRYRFEDMRRDLGMTGQHQHLARIAINIEPFDYNLTIGGHATTTRNLANSSVEDMVLFIYDRDDGRGLRVDFDANPSLYTKEELLEHRRRFERFVCELVDNPSAPIGDVDLLSEAESCKLIVDWNDTACALPDKAVFQHVEKQAQCAPKAIAVRYGDTNLSYAELNGRANFLARTLIDAGVGAGDIVALALRSSEMYPIAVLGVNKTGAAFLPISPDDPAARQAQIFEDANVKSIITLGDDAKRLPPCSAKIVNLSSIGTNTDPRDVTDQERSKPFHLSDPAYVIYTSGSTGLPKGVVLAHEGLANMIADAVDIVPLSSSDRLMAVATPTFDASILEIHAPLSVGATLVVAPMETIREPMKLADLMRREAITTATMSPSLWNALIACRGAQLRGFKAIVGGETLTSKLARTLHDLGAIVINFYGPTETTVLCTGMKIGDSELAAPPIGKPIRNMRTYILDENLKPLPIGVAGELCIGGVGVGLGYLNRPALTAKRFSQDPFGPKGARLYRTGDLARWRGDGVLEFLGRRDRQLKIRGFRIEPGEVETVLSACAGVEAVHVDTIENPKGGKRLAAFVTAKKGAQLDKEQIKDALSEKLPNYLIPSAIFILEAMPLTRNGKIDRNALPKTDDRVLTGYVAPRTDTEQKLVDIFATMLGIEKVGVEDNFFELGADSLTAVQLLIEIESQFSTQLSLLSLFDAPTIANLAKQMDNEAAPDPFAAVFPFRRQGSEEPLFCIHSVIGISWSYAGLLRHLSERHPVYGLQARGLSSANNEALPKNIDAMADDYLAEVRAIQPHGPYRFLGWSLGGLVAHAMTEKLEAANERVEFLCLLDSFPFAHAANGARHDEALLAENALRFMNYSPDKTSKWPQDVASLAEFMFQEFDLFSTPILRKAGFDNKDLRLRFQNVIANNFKAALNQRPGIVKADLHVIRAAERNGSKLDGLVEHQAGAWKRYTDGRVIESCIQCHHFEMLNPEPLEIIGPIIRDAL